MAADDVTGGATAGERDRREGAGGADAPDLRFLQANERTLLSWARTSVGLMAFGFVIARIAVWLRLEHPERDESEASFAIGVAIVALSAVFIAIGAVRYVRAHRAIVERRPHVPSVTGPVLVAAAVAFTGVGLAAYLAGNAL